MAAFIQFQFRRGTTLEWSTTNPVLAQGEMGLDISTHSYRVGDGVTPWNSLPSAFNRSLNVEGPLITITAGSPSATIADGVNFQPVLLENNATITLPTQTDRHLIQVEVLQDATGGRAITFAPPSTYSIIWDGSTSAPQLNTVANKQTSYMFAYTPGSTVIRGVRNFYPA